MKQRGIDNVMVMGVHTNMCVLGRPFSIRQLTYQDQNVVLVRDLTDTMYNPRMPPYVSHFSGTDLVVDHIEKHWCPTMTSNQLVGGKPFRFKNDRRPHLVVVMAEREYRTKETLTDFTNRQLADDFRITFVHADEKDGNNLVGIGAMDHADIALLSIRRRTPREDQLKIIRCFVDEGKPLVAIRTSSHAFALSDSPPPEGHAAWPEFDRQVLGCFYQGHHGNKPQDDPSAPITYVQAIERSKHPVLSGVRRDEFPVFSWLYKSNPLATTATPLLTARIEGKPEEPVAWVNTTPAGGRVFYTSLGHPREFRQPAFQQLLVNAVRWAASLPVEDSPRITTADTAARGR